jgi:hypothetical protein
MKLTASATGWPAEAQQAPVITVANGHVPDLLARPYWQDQPCPPWCHMPVPHQDHDNPGDRFHMAPFHDIQLTLEAADITRIPSADGKVALEVSPSFITAGLIQGWRDREAHVTLIHAASHDIELTIAEAAELAEALADLIQQAMEAEAVQDDTR